MSGLLHLNHAGSCWPRPAPVQRAVAEALAAPPEQGAALLADATDRVCRRLGIDDSARFVFTPGCTAALATALDALRLEPGSAVLTSALEHHALVRPLELARRRGVAVEVAPYAEQGGIDPEFVAQRLARGDVGLVAVSAASNVTGQCLPVRALSALARAHGVPLLVDAAQLAGVDPTPVSALGADLLAFAGHKGPQGPQGIGGLCWAPGVAFDAVSAQCAIGTAPAETAHGPDYCDVGGANLAGAAGLAAGLDWLAARGPDPFSAARAARATLRAALAERPRCRILGGAGAHTAALGFVLEGLPLSRAEAHFRAHGLGVRAGRHCADRALEALGAPEGCIRVSFGPECPADAVERVLAAVDAAPAG